MSDTKQNRAATFFDLLNEQERAIVLNEKMSAHGAVSLPELGNYSTEFTRAWLASSAANGFDKGYWLMQGISNEEFQRYETAFSDALDSGAIDASDMVTLAMKSRHYPVIQATDLLRGSDQHLEAFAAAANERAQALRQDPSIPAEYANAEASFLEQNATIALTASPTLISEHFDNRADTVEAFLQLVAYTNTHPAKAENPGDPDASHGPTAYNEGLRAAARLFEAHPDWIVDSLTGRFQHLSPEEKAQNASEINQMPRAEELAHFLTRTMLDPNAHQIKMEDGRSVGEVVAEAMQARMETYVDVAMDASQPNAIQRDAASAMGVVLGSLAIATRSAAKEYNDQLADDQATRELLVDTALSIIPLGRLAKAAGDNLADVVRHGNKEARAAMRDTLVEAMASDGEDRQPFVGAMQKALDEVIPAFRQRIHSSTSEAENDLSRDLLDDLQTNFNTFKDIDTVLSGDLAAADQGRTPNGVQYAAAGDSALDLATAIDALHQAAAEGDEQALNSQLAALGKDARAWLASTQETVPAVEAVSREAMAAAQEAESQAHEASSRVA